MINLFEYIKEKKELNTLLMHECDIYFYQQSKETDFLSNHELYTMPCEAFAKDGSGGEFVFLNDGSIYVQFELRSLFIKDKIQEKLRYNTTVLKL